MLSFMKRTKAIFAIILIILLIVSIGSVVFAASELPSTSEKAVIEKAAKMLEDMGNKSMAENIRTWVKGNKIKINDELAKSKYGNSNRKGIITLNDDLVQSLPSDDLKAFKRIAILASTLLHEKTHAHQAPEGGSLYENIKTGDWSASIDVMKECVGPDALEVEAYYKEIKAYLDWANKINEEKISDDLSKEAKAKAEKLKTDKVTWLKSEAMRWSRTLKKHNYEKSNKIKLGYIYDEMKNIDDNTKLTQGEKIKQMAAKLDARIKKLFESGNFYDKMREIYKNKQGEKKKSKTVDPKKKQMVTLMLPDEKSRMTIVALEPTVKLYPIDDEEELLSIEVYDFMIPPDPKIGYTYVSPVYDIRWNAAQAIDYELELWITGENIENAELMALGLERDTGEDWTVLESQIELINQEEGMLIGHNDVASMVAVMVPSPSYSDVPMDHWSYEATERLRHRNILDKDVDTLNPTMDVTREHFIKYLVKALELDLIEEPIPFEDVDVMDPLFPFISTAYYNGLTQGVDETTFGYGDVLTREQSMTFLVRSQNRENEANALSESEINSKLEQFVDEDTEISQWARKYIVLSMNMGITEGYPDQTMRGRKLLNHAEVITLIDRMIQSIE
ncbi:MAG TPA: S-layer homology domain-containing protein [Clostridia bacterium]|nr:S-layer homology domain-containing protein [Clostridia bacterium]